MTGCVAGDKDIRIFCGRGVGLRPRRPRAEAEAETEADKCDVASRSDFAGCEGADFALVHRVHT